MNLHKVLLPSLIALSVVWSVAPLFAQSEEDTMPPLRYAIYRGDTAKVQQALRNGADVNAIDDRDTMLCWALRGDNPEVTKLLRNRQA